MRHPRRWLPLLLLCVSVALVGYGLGRGSWLSNLHNGVLGVAFTAVGAYLVHERPGQRLGGLFLATGLVETVMFLGRQVGHDPAASDAVWGAWLGVWPLPVGLGLTTLCVLCFPDGHLPSRRWPPLVLTLLVLLGTCAVVSLLWPVAYADSEVSVPPPFALPGSSGAGRVWSALAHPAYVVCQVLWVVAIAQRWRGSGPVVRRQLAVLAAPVVLSVLALAVGLAAWSTPTAGLLTASLVPVAAGWAVVQGSHLLSSRALTWISRSRATGDALPDDLAAAVAEATGSRSAVVWMGRDDAMVAVGVWPESEEPLAPTTVEDLAPTHHVRPVRHGSTLGALSVPREEVPALSRTQEQVLDGLAGQAALVLDNLTLARLIDRGRGDGLLDRLTPREHDVLQLMAEGLSNAAICARLHLSVKTVEPAVSSIFTKLGLPQDSQRNRRVLAVVELLRSEASVSRGPTSPAPPAPR